MEKAKKKQEKKDAIFSPFVKLLLIVALVIVGAYFIVSTVTGDPREAPNNTEFPESMCYEIPGTPTWVQNEEIIRVGYWELENMSFNYAEDFINKEIYFFYDPHCPYCEKQVEALEERWPGSWEQYKESNYTINCRDVILGN